LYLNQAGTLVERCEEFVDSAAWKDFQEGFAKLSQNKEAADGGWPDVLKQA
jgi:hypothetical protein